MLLDTGDKTDLTLFQQRLLFARREAIVTDYRRSCIQVKSMTEIKSASLFVVLLSQSACVQMDRTPSGLESRAHFFPVETKFQNLALLCIRYERSEGKHLQYS